MATAGYREVVYDDGDQYKGDWNAQGKVSLRGQEADFSYRAGRVVVRRVVWSHVPLPALQREGKGTLIFADGSKYQGGFADGMCSGYGVLTFPGGQCFWKWPWCIHPCSVGAFDSPPPCSR